MTSREENYCKAVSLLVAAPRQKDAYRRAHNRFIHSSRSDAIRLAKEEKGVAIQSIRGRQWVVSWGTPANVREIMTSLRESLAYLGKSPPKIIADFRKK